MSGTTGYSKFHFQMPTALHPTDGQWRFETTDWDGDRRPDLVCIRRSGSASGKIEVHILSAASNYQQFILHTTTPLDFVGDNFDFKFGDWDGDARPDLITIWKNQNGSNTTELHIISGASNFTQFLLQTDSALHATDSTWSFEVSDWDSGGKIDLIGFKKTNTGTGNTEIHIISGESFFKQFILQIGTALPQLGQETDLLLAKDSEIGDFDPLAKRYSYNQEGIYVFRNDELLEFTDQAPGGWRLIEKNSTLTDTASTAGQLFQFRQNTGQILVFDKQQNNWQVVSNDINNIGITATSDNLYLLQNSSRSGAIYKYNGVPNSWSLLSQDPLSVSLGATDEALFQMHSTGRILQWNSSGWVTISTSYATRQMATTSSNVFARRENGEILMFSDDNWVTISNPDNSVSTIYSDGESIYRKHLAGYIYRYIGTPLTGWQLVNW